jgi:hypothetical protein
VQLAVSSVQLAVHVSPPTQPGSTAVAHVALPTLVVSHGWTPPPQLTGASALASAGALVLSIPNSCAHPLTATTNPIVQTHKMRIGSMVA